MINNRQAGRRNRGRNNNNNGRPGGQNRGGADNGNRIDNRARGNATQLLEKYRNMARDAQLSGDRVNAEYYLQFADHYFRVLADNRARQEEAQGGQPQPRQPQRPWDPESDGDDFDSTDGNNDYEDRNAYAQQGNGNRDNGRDNRDQGQREQVQRDQSNREQGNRDQGSRDQQGQRDGNRDTYRRDRPQQPPRREDVVQADATPHEERSEPRRGRGRPPREAPARDVQAESSEPAFLQNEAPVVVSESDEAPRARRGQRRPRENVLDHDEPVGLDLAVLPPAIARADNDSDSAPAAEEAPRKRTRRVRPAATEAAE